MPSTRQDTSRYVVDEDGGDEILRIDPTGAFTVIAGSGVHDNGPTDTAGDGGPATEARTWASNMAIGPAGDMYFEGWDRFRRIDSSGIVHPFAGPGVGHSFAGDGGPALDASLSNDVSTTPAAADLSRQRLTSLRERSDPQR